MCRRQLADQAAADKEAAERYWEHIAGTKDAPPSTGPQGGGTVLLERDFSAEVLARVEQVAAALGVDKAAILAGLRRQDPALPRVELNLATMAQPVTLRAMAATLERLANTELLRHLDDVEKYGVAA